MAEDYELLWVERDAGVVFATLDNPPVNVMTLSLFAELTRFGREVAEDEDVRVVVFRSADPDFFIAHFDVEALLALPVETEPARRAENPFHQLCEQYRTMPVVTIAQIEGRVGGGGSELVQAFDMRFGVVGRTRVSQMEVALGILPGGGGTQRLPRLVGRGRALEMILAAEDLDAETAERWGYLNRALSAGEIGPFVERLARRIASFPPEAVRLAKAAVDCVERPLAEGLREEAFLFQKLLASEDARCRMRRFLEVGGQTREGELRVSELCREVSAGR